MKRRGSLASAFGAVAFTAGCTGGSRPSASENYHDITDPNPSTTDAGLAPNPAEVEARDVDPSSFETYNATNDASTNL